VQRDELSAWLRLALTPGVGPAAARRLLAAFGLPEALFAQSPAALRQVVGNAQADALRMEPPGFADQLNACWQWLHEAAPGTVRRVLSLADPDYPKALLQIEDPPLLLYLLGADPSNEKAPGADSGSSHSAIDSIATGERRSVAIVGSRNPTPQGARHARGFARALAEAGLTIVSGLALGIDAEAHLGALEGAAPDRPQPATIAVVGTGLDRVYPKKNLALAHRIAQRGLLLSEFPLGTPPLAANFPRRNRLIAALAQGTLVVEAALQSGSLITARLAAEQGKEVFAIPGSIDSTQSRGCHALIRQGAKLVETAQDVLEELHLTGAPAAAEGVAEPKNLTPSQQDLLGAMGHEPASLDALQARTGLATPVLQAALLELELAGLVGRLPGALFQRVGRA
jgi:DNA processing protein